MAIFPGGIATDADLCIAVNNLSNQLSSAIDNIVTTIPVDSTAGFPTAGFISIDDEIIKYTGTTGASFTGCTRGSDGTIAISHLDNAAVHHNIVAAHHNLLKDEIIAIENSLPILTDYFSSASINGLSTPSGNIYYCSMGNRLVSINYSISGTATALGYMNFTLPYLAWRGVGLEFPASATVIDNGSPYAGKSNYYYGIPFGVIVQKISGSFTNGMPITVTGYFWFLRD